MSDENEKLKKRIAELEAEVADRESDLSRFRVELKQANERLESLISQMSLDLKMAHTIQRILVPTQFPHIGSFEFSTKFIPSALRGGDYFDIFEHEDRLRFGMVLASSSGHAMSALFISALLKLSGQLEARKGSGPDEIVEKILDDLKPNLGENDHADLFYALIDQRKFEMSYCRLGSVFCLVQEYASGELKILDSIGEAINKNFNTSLSVNTVELNPRDRVILCSPGITEVQNLEDEHYGQERLFKSIARGPKRGVHELRNHVIHEAQQFASGREWPRDITVIVSEVKDRVIKLAKN